MEIENITVYREMKLEVLKDFGLKIIPELETELNKRSTEGALDRYCHSIIETCLNDRRVKGSKHLYKLIIRFPCFPSTPLTEREILSTIGEQAFRRLLEKKYLKLCASPLGERYYALRR